MMFRFKVLLPRIGIDKKIEEGEHGGSAGYGIWDIRFLGYAGWFLNPMVLLSKNQWPPTPRD